jgi:1-acyl-sn-glycerol-3-phosphate acyltransferase
LKKTGGLPVDRSKGAPILKQIIDAFKSHEIFHLAITPEGTRKRTKNWKAGFHAIAKATGATVYLGYFDWGRKEIGWYEPFELTDNAQADIKRMKAFYRTKGLTGKHPELFTLED